MLYFSRWKTISIWLVVILGLLYAMPNVVSPSWLNNLPGWAPKNSLTLGLDLQGGSHILLQIDREGLLEDRLESAADAIRTNLRDERIGYTGLREGDNYVQVRIRDGEQLAAARDALSLLTEPISSGIFGAGVISEMNLSEPEEGVLRYTLSDDGMAYRTSTALNQSIEVIGRRVNELGTTEPIIQRQGDDRILVQVPGLDDPDRLKDIIGQTAQLTFQMVDQSIPIQEALDSRPPPGTTIRWSTDEPPQPYLIENRVIISGENLVDAQATYDQRTNEPVVSFRFDNQGAVRFGQTTQRNVGSLFAIILDDEVISAPQIREPIMGGTGQISGNFTTQSANDLAVLLRAGALPADLTIVEERTVGPSLGQDSIDAGSIATVVAAIGVLAFMLLAYGTLGVIANIALIVNISLLVAILSAIGATLTLPGIAGIVLTIGMAVDSNVIIFERVREERAAGRSMIQSLDAGFRNAMSTIIDANVTTFLVALVMFYLGSGPIRGFAVTLAIGIITTVFTAVLFTRWMIAFWMKTRKPKELPQGLVHRMPIATNFGFMWLRNWAFAISAGLIVLSAALFFTVQMNLGIDFRGGSSIEVQALEGNADAADVRARLSQFELGDIQVQEFGSPEDLLIRIGAQGGGDTAEQQALQLVQTELASDYEFRRIEIVGPTISAELARNGTIAVIAAILAMSIYIWLRFEWHFALGVGLTSIHDAVVVVGFFVLTGIEFNLSSIAAVMTVVGYSINDTVVVYDRVRENLRKFKRMPISELVDLTINQTLSRTILTGVSTLIALIALFMFGGEVIASFTAAIIFGIIMGALSSVFVAGPLLILFDLRPGALTKDDQADKKDEQVDAQPTKA